MAMLENSDNKFVTCKWIQINSMKEANASISGCFHYLIIHIVRKSFPNIFFNYTKLSNKQVNVMTTIHAQNNHKIRSGYLVIHFSNLKDL